MAGALEPVEDQVEAELEAALVALRRVEVVLDVLHEVGVVRRRDLREEAPREARQLLARVRELLALDSGSENVGVEDVVAVVDQLLRETCLPKGSEQPVRAPKRRRSGALPGHL